MSNANDRRALLSKLATELGMTIADFDIHEARAPKRNWFDTLNGALTSEGLVESYPHAQAPLAYGETSRYYIGEGEDTRVVILYRDSAGRYERPVHYHTFRNSSHATCKK